MIDLQTAIYIWEHYGWMGILSLIVGSYIIYDRVVSSKKKKIASELKKEVDKLKDKVEIVEEKVENMHEGCNVPENSIKTLFQEVEELKLKSIETDGDINTFKAEVRSDLKNLKGGQRDLQTGINNILQHLMKG
jgi:uncharacterized coiled-coil DUF342 family protein